MEIDIYGHDLAGANVDDIYECQQFCQFTPNCKYWTLMPSNGYCMAKSTLADYSSQDNRITGAKDCSPNQPSNSMLNLLYFI